MRSLLNTLTAGSTALVLSGCPDLLGGGPVPAQSDSHRTVSRPVHTAHESAEHSVSEIAWFQGTIDEAFSHRRCSESHPRRMLFRF